MPPLMHVQRSSPPTPTTARAILQHCLHGPVLLGGARRESSQLSNNSKCNHSAPHHPRNQSVFVHTVESHSLPSDARARMGQSTRIGTLGKCTRHAGRRCSRRDHAQNSLRKGAFDRTGHGTRRSAEGMYKTTSRGGPRMCCGRLASVTGPH